MIILDFIARTILITSLIGAIYLDIKEREK